jgi:hypothetical protein
MGGENAP